MNTNGLLALKPNGHGTKNGNGSTNGNGTRNAAGTLHHHPSLNHIVEDSEGDLQDTVERLEKQDEMLGDDHVGTSIDTPLRDDAFMLAEEDKMAVIEKHFEQIMLTMGLDLTDDSLRGTPHRVAKMFVREIFYGLDPAKKPVAKVFDNKFKYGEMLVEKNISLHTTCEHHFLPIVGRAHVAYISSGTVIGLSKINRIVDYFARRPQVQERLTMQIVDELKRALETEDVAVVIDAKHFCVAARGIQDTHSSTVTAEFSGRFKEDRLRKEFLQYINLPATA